MIKKIKDLFKKDDQVSLGTMLPKDEAISFILNFKEIKVGKLSCSHGTWYFEYFDEYKSLANDYYPIVGFPDLDKVYKRDSLWPFFQLRIPGLGQPKVKLLIENEDIDIKNEAQLLKRFGRQSISNPFILTESKELEPINS